MPALDICRSQPTLLAEPLIGIVVRILVREERKRKRLEFVLVRLRRENERFDRTVKVRGEAQTGRHEAALHLCRRG